MIQSNKILLLISGLLLTWSSYANQTVDSQVTDSITQSNVKVVGEAPAESMGNLPVQSVQEVMQSNSIAECQFESDHCACIHNRLVASTYNTNIIKAVLKENQCPSN